MSSLDSIITGTIATIVGGVILAYLLDTRFKGLVDRSTRWAWLHVSLFLSRNWTWLSFICLVGLAALIYSSTQNLWVFLLAYALWTTCVLAMRKKVQLTSPVLSCILDGHHDENDSTGLRLVLQYDDGKVIEDMQGGLLCRRTDNKSGQHYFYFSISPNQKSTLRKKSILVSVEYFDLDQNADGADKGKRGITLKYDAVGNGHENIFRKGGEVLFTSSNSWKFATFCLVDGNFESRQNGIGDFRFACLYPSPKRDYDIFIRRVIVVPIQN
jgi:hypothetical protein